MRANCAGEKPDIMVTGDDCSFMGTDTEVSNVVEGKVLLRLSFYNAKGVT